MLTLTFHTDPGHGWLEVNLSLVKKLGLAISQYSYIKDTKAYLEEDCDAGKLLEALKVEGVEVAIVEKHIDNEHYIRQYDRF